MRDGAWTAVQWLSEVRYQDPATRTYLGSPSLVRLPDGAILATHDHFGPCCPKNHEGEACLTSVHRSEDDGASWHAVTHIVGAFWSSLFWHRDAVYLLGASAQYGHIVIRRSRDGGRTWTHPADGGTGLLFPGGPHHAPPNYHCAPMPVLEAGGRLYRAFEDNDPLHWPRGFRSCVISCASDADLLEAGNWRMSNRLAYDPASDPPGWGGGSAAGWLEGSVVEAPDGSLCNVLRVNSRPAVDRGAVVRIHDGGARVTFDPADFIEVPGGMSKFSIRRDPETGLYWTVANNNTDPACATQRNVLSLCASADLRRWRHAATLMEDDQGLPWAESVAQTGFQYADWQFDGEDLICLVRTAYGGAHNYHDANRITFMRVRGFRARTPAGLGGPGSAEGA